MTRETLIERIEGEAVLETRSEAGSVAFAAIRFPHIRGMERLLAGRPGTDALVVTPRVCGICGHSHLMATVEALEAAWRNAGAELTLTSKARKIREITLMLELVQNHFKWFYLVIYPELFRLLGREPAANAPLKGAHAAALANRASALFSGQWPHSSYAVPGGVTCDPTAVELLRAEAAVDETIRFFEREFAGTGLEHFLVLKQGRELDPLCGDLAVGGRMLLEAGMHEKGRSFDRFMVLGDHSYARSAKLIGTTPRRADASRTEVSRPYTLGGESMALNARYDGKYFETGPLARAMAMDYHLIKSLHRRFRDSAYTRVLARLYETGALLYRIKQQLHTLDLSEPSYIAPGMPLREITAEGQGVVEAPRGALIHRITLERGKITAYEMITPTQWNLGSGPPEAPGVAQRAMIGTVDAEEAAFILRCFDVCSVCTTH